MTIIRSFIRVGSPVEEGGDGLVTCIEGGRHQWCFVVLSVWLQGDSDDGDNVSDVVEEIYPNSLLIMMDFDEVWFDY